MPSLSVSGWITAFVPKATSPAVVTFLRSQLEAASRNEALKQQLESQGFILNRMPGAEVDAYVQNETSRWADVVKKTGFRGN